MNKIQYLYLLILNVLEENTCRPYTSFRLFRTQSHLVSRILFYVYCDRSTINIYGDKYMYSYTLYVLYFKFFCCHNQMYTTFKYAFWIQEEIWASLWRWSRFCVCSMAASIESRHQAWVASMLRSDDKVRNWKKKKVGPVYFLNTGIISDGFQIYGFFFVFQWKFE